MKKSTVLFIVIYFVFMRFSFPGVYTPAREGLVLWLDAGDESTVIRDKAGMVEKWKDKSGAQRDATVQEKSQSPKYVHTANGTPSVDFSGKDICLTVPEIGDQKMTATIIIVFDQPEASTVDYPRLFSGTSGEAWQDEMAICPNHIPGGEPNKGKNKAPVSVASRVYTDKWAKKILLGLCSYPLNACQFHGRMYEVIVYSRALTTGEISEIQGELEKKWKNVKSGKSNPADTILKKEAAGFSGVTADGLPAGMKWKLVWSDEFEGKEIDSRKFVRQQAKEWNWPDQNTKYSESNLFLDGKGSLVLLLSKDSDGTIRYNQGIASTFRTTYGYFEARVQFSSQPGWFTSFFLSGMPNENGADTFLSTQEFDIFEDFYKPKIKNDISHCYHCSVNAGFGDDTQRSGIQSIADEIKINRVSYGSLSTGSAPVILEKYDGWHTVGLQWTPLEHIFYVDGRETHRQSYSNVPVTTQPLFCRITGEFRVPKNASVQPYFGRLENAVLPDRLMVDYVRIYKEDIGERREPAVAVRLRGKPVVDEPVVFEVSAEAFNGTLEKIIIFSMGRLRAESSVAAAKTSINFSLKNLFVDHENTIIVMAKDSSGLVGQSKPLSVKFLTGRENDNKPFEGKYQQIPGSIRAGLYDAGGQGVAYQDTTPGNFFKNEFRKDEDMDAANENAIGAISAGEWVKYSIEVTKSGTYRAVARVGRPKEYGTPSVLVLKLDENTLTQFSWDTCTASWGVFEEVPAQQQFFLEKGRYVLKVIFRAGAYDFGGIDFEGL